MSDISVILAALGGDQPNPGLEAELMAMGRYQPSNPANALTYQGQVLTYQGQTLTRTAP